MSTVDSITANRAEASAGKTSAFSELNSEEFVRIIFAELANQDPLKPNDSNQLIQQLANLRSIQADIDLTAKLKTLVTENQLASAGNLMGTHISGLDERFNRVEGLVVSISRTADGPVLNLHTGARVRLRDVDEVIDPRLFADPADPAGPPSPPAPPDPPSPPAPPVGQDPDEDTRPGEPSPPIVVVGPATPTNGRSIVPDAQPAKFPLSGAN